MNLKQERSIKALFDALEKRGDVMKSQYVKNSIHVDVECGKCGHVYPITPNNYKRGHGCPSCKRVVSRSCQMSKVEEAERRLIDVTIKRGDRLLGEYINARTKIDIQCGVCSSIYSMTPNNYKNGQGCPHCAVYCFDPSRAASLYVVRWLKDTHSFIKFGITNRSVAKRIAEQVKTTDYVPDVIYTMRSVDGYSIKDMENRLKSLCNKYGRGANVDQFLDGYTETLPDSAVVMEEIDKIVLKVLDVLD